jgi:hypothetical protein
MTTLTHAAITTRKIIRYAIFSIIALIILRIILIGVIKIYKKVFPPPPPAPTVTFGKLPKLKFPQKQVPANLTFTLETAEGGFPKLPVQAKVYFMPKIAANLLSLDAAKTKAQSLGFKPDGQEISTTTYRFLHQSAPSILEMNIVLGIFSVSYDLKIDPTPLDVRPPAPEVAAANIRSLLSSANLLPNDLTGPASHQYLKLQEGKFVPVLSLSEANLIKVNFFRKAYDNLPCLSANPESANVWFTVSGASEREKQVVAAQYHYLGVDESQSATYPLKATQDVWNELGEGSAYLASAGTIKEGENIKIRKIYLAYFDPPETADFLQPIFVFEGDKGFTAYVPAVTGDYYGE